MTLTTKRGSATTKVSEFQSLVAGSHDPAQRTAKLSEIATAYGDVGGEVVRARASDRTSTTDAFYASSIETICGNFDSFHKSTGGTNMYEMFCRPVPITPPITPYAYPLRVHSINSTSPKPVVPYPTIADFSFSKAPLVLLYPAGSNIVINLYGVFGTMTVVGGDTYNCPSGRDFTVMDLPDVGDGFAVILIEGGVSWLFNDHERTMDRLAVLQWGTNCWIRNFRNLFFLSAHPCEITAVDLPPIGIDDPCDSTYSIFSRCTLRGGKVNVVGWDINARIDLSDQYMGSTFYGTAYDGGLVDFSVWEIAYKHREKVLDGASTNTILPTWV